MRFRGMELLQKTMDFAIKLYPIIFVVTLTNPEANCFSAAIPSTFTDINTNTNNTKNNLKCFIIPSIRIQIITQN